jgi:hypothetical protein
MVRAGLENSVENLRFATCRERENPLIRPSATFSPTKSVGEKALE